MSETTLPKWFNGEIYTEGDNVRNIFSGETYYLNNEELSMYDYVMGLQLVIDRIGAFDEGSFKYQKQLRKALNWFRKTNPEAYMVLLD